ncbi:hypothetical protein MAR_020015 [Mya arenaria]|uniref:Snake toxin/toxin-like domain-containing protein n=1 Tax=Mya arenaria TaxID=6604 RepID=A0ABY7EBY4_MYAAR|nr:hypothetical protein MAR_020015 [Mya arenaria]
MCESDWSKQQLVSGRALTCYHCIDPVTDVQSCTATKQCQMGEKCMTSEVSSSKDGHHEYRLNCASNMMCDGSMIFSIVGRRDISSHCCSVDLCNQPDATATCQRDIYILVEAFLHDDKTTDMLLSQFLSALASSLPADSQASLAVFDRGIYFLVHFADSTQLLNYNTSTFISPHHSILDYDRTMHDLRNVLQHQDNGARANASDAVLFITNDRSDDRNHGHLHLHGSYLDGLASSVTVIDVGSRNPALASLLATDANHEIAVPTYQGLMSVVPQVVSLLCS